MTVYITLHYINLLLTIIIKMSNVISSHAVPKEQKTWPPLNLTVLVIINQYYL